MPHIDDYPTNGGCKFFVPNSPPPPERSPLFDILEGHCNFETPHPPHIWVDFQYVAWGGVNVSKDDEYHFRSVKQYGCSGKFEDIEE